MLVVSNINNKQFLVKGSLAVWGIRTDELLLKYLCNTSQTYHNPSKVIKKIGWDLQK